MTRAAACLQAGDMAGAATAYAAAARLKPGWFPALANLGVVLARLQRYPEAEAALGAALLLKPDSEPVLTTLTGTLTALGRIQEAIAAGRRAVSADPRRPEAWCNLGVALQAQGQLGEAREAYEQALGIDPEYALAIYNHSHVINDEWNAPDALQGFRRAIDLDPAYQPAWHTWLMNLLYDPSQDERSLFEAHREWARRLPEPEVAVAMPVAGMRDGRPVRVGYLSPDFRRHSCAYFLRPLFAAHDRTCVEVYAYSSTARQDDYTRWFAEHADHWRDIARLPDDAVANLIRSDGIDVLVDLAGHTKNQPLGVFLRQPAPIQVSWLGYPATTGLSVIRFRLTDGCADPRGDADRFHSEKLIRLPGGFHCYEPPGETPATGPLPASRGGAIRFASFNNPAKLTPETIVTWAEILRRVPKSTLLLKGRQLASDRARVRIAASFRDAGVEEGRLEMRPWAPDSMGALEQYGEVDIALDTYPFNGTTTTFEALWMGVPVVTMRDHRHAGRVGASILTHVGHPEWIADDADAYVQIAAGLSADLPALAAIRRGLRSELAASTLMDARGFARKLEQVYGELMGAGSP